MISEEEVALRVFFIGYISHSKLMYVDYMKKAKLWADFLMPKEVVENDVAHFIDPYPIQYAPDICVRCRTRYDDTLGGRLRQGCHRCTTGYDEREVSPYEVSELSKILGISYHWCEIFVARILACHFPPTTS